MEIEKLFSKEAELETTNNNIVPNFIELLHNESQREFDQPRKLFFKFSGTIKKLKRLISLKETYGKKFNNH